MESPQGKIAVGARVSAEAALRPRLAPSALPRRQRDGMAPGFTLELPVPYPRAPAFPFMIAPRWGQAHWVSPVYQRQARNHSGGDGTKIFRYGCRERHVEAVKRTTCDPLVEPIERDKRARSCGCASCVHCPRSISATWSRRYVNCATIFSATNGCRRQK